MSVGIVKDVEMLRGQVKDNKSVDSARDSRSGVGTGGSLFPSTKHTDSGPRQEWGPAARTPVSSLGADRTAGTGRQVGMPTVQFAAGTSCGDGQSATGTALGRKSAARPSHETTLVATRQEDGHGTSRRVIEVDDTHLYSNDDHETSRPEKMMLRNSKKLVDSNSNLTCNPSVVTDDLAGLTNNRGREGRPVRVRFKPDRLIDTYGKALFRGKDLHTGGHS